MLETLAVCAIAGGQARAIQDPPPAAIPPVLRHEAGHLLDFWIGLWEVVAEDGRRIASAAVEKILGGRAVLEHWRGIAGDERKRLYLHRPASGEWTEVAVVEATGWREKILVASAPGTVCFQGELSVLSGPVLLDRTTFHPLDEQRVRQVVERSRDGGVTWQAVSSAVYVRREQS